MFNQLLNTAIALCLFSACSRPTNQINPEFKNFNYDELKSNAVTIEEAREFFHIPSEFIELEMTEQSMVGFVSKVSITDSSIFILAHDQLMKFGRDGKFKNQIGKIGQGPEEVVSLTDFTVDRKSQKVYVFDTMGQKIVVYDTTNNYLTSIPFGGIARNIVYWNNQLCASSMNFLGIDSVSFVTLNPINGDTLASSINPVRYDAEEFFIESYHPTLQPLEKDLLLRQDYNDTIYTCRENQQGLTPKYVFDFGDEKLSYAILRTMETYEKQCSAYIHLIDFMESPELIFVSMMDKGKIVSYVIDKRTNEYYSLKGNHLKNDRGFDFWPSCYSNGFFVSFITPEQVLEHQESIKDEKLKLIASKLKEDSNPILVLSNVRQ